MTGSDLLTGLAFVLIVEGLVYALAPSLVERLLEALRAMPPEMRQVLGLLTLTTGILLLWVAR
ncbi:DUF2065 domain-containing protein [Allosediminivita pacifica]|uniref:DUF2065 domain-containing protein n=1 Tax=Allosediminivita pacifica TaxID=1267769 RepID=A0A2T6AQG5_9RHOB|nr:DUF2065 domain-containing protein [Allosediminivita pacifica]PTX46069.1 hypothetical protein C8N44_11845 [Allosediminivita pacifica]GGB18557.1 membrane protein [Allosediminivita pacifica]